MSTTTTTPAVYVGTYHKYNCGSIFGKRFDLTEFDGREDFYEAWQALPAGEYAAYIRQCLMYLWCQGMNIGVLQLVCVISVLVIIPAYFQAA